MREVGAPLRSCCQYSGGKELISQHIHGPSTAVNGRSNCCLFPLEGTSFCPAPTAGTAHWEQMTARRRAAAGRCLQERRVPEQRGCGGGVGLWGDRASPSFAIPRAGKTRAMSGRRGGAERPCSQRAASLRAGPARGAWLRFSRRPAGGAAARPGARVRVWREPPGRLFPSRPGGAGRGAGALPACLPPSPRGRRGVFPGSRPAGGSGRRRQWRGRGRSLAPGAAGPERRAPAPTCPARSRKQVSGGRPGGAAALLLPALRVAARSCSRCRCCLARARRGPGAGDGGGPGGFWAGWGCCQAGRRGGLPSRAEPRSCAALPRWFPGGFSCWISFFLLFSFSFISSGFVSSGPFLLFISFFFLSFLRLFAVVLFPSPLAPLPPFSHHPFSL